MEIVPASDRALLVRLSDHQQVAAFARALDLAGMAGVTSYSPAYTSVLVRYDPVVQDADDLQRTLAEMATSPSASTPKPRELVLPVQFDGSDLEELAQGRGMRTSEVVEIFCAVVYRVYFLGFIPGFAYMGDVDERIASPRRPSPRKSVPAGSVGIAGRQTGIYPVETPGGWNLIGRCPVPMFVPERHPPCLLEIGDSVRFEPA
jgi:KipI family sensor histidine kinase inhibitor